MKNRRRRRTKPFRRRFSYAFRQLSEAKQKTTRYAGGDKMLYKNHLTQYIIEESSHY